MHVKRVGLLHANDGTHHAQLILVRTSPVVAIDDFGEPSSMYRISGTAIPVCPGANRPLVFMFLHPVDEKIGAQAAPYYAVIEPTRNLLVYETAPRLGATPSSPEPIIRRAINMRGFLQTRPVSDRCR